MTRGKSVCNVLKTIRKQVADANNIKYEPRECTHQGECQGTCPACEAEVRYIERELRAKRQLGRVVRLAGVSAGLAALCACANTVRQQPGNGGQSEELLGRTPLSDIQPLKAETATVGKVLSPVSRDTVILDRNTEREHVFGEVAEQMPWYPGGSQAMLDFIKNEMKYPKEFDRDAIPGRVILTFTVEKDGSLSHVIINKGIEPALDCEAIRIIKAMPRWIPGKQNGVAVAVKYTIPITFPLFPVE